MKPKKQIIKLLMFIIICILFSSFSSAVTCDTLCGSNSTHILCIDNGSLSCTGITATKHMIVKNTKLITGGAMSFSVDGNLSMYNGNIIEYYGEAGVIYEMD